METKQPSVLYRSIANDISVMIQSGTLGTAIPRAELVPAAKLQRIVSAIARLNPGFNA